MNAFVLFVFWIEILAIVIHAIELCKEHPRPREPVPVGVDCLSLIMSISIMAWASYLLWGAK